MLKLISILLAICSVLTPIAGQKVKNSACAKGVHLIVTSGNGGAADGYGSILAGLVQDVLDNIPGSTAVSVPFDKGVTSAYRESIAGASTTGKKYLEQYVKSCPYGRVVMLGYSSVSAHFVYLTTLRCTALHGFIDRRQTR